MYTFKSTKAVPSQTFPGVDIVLRKLTESQRIKLQLATGALNSEIRKLLVDIRNIDLTDEKDRDLVELGNLNDKLNMLLTEKLNPAKIKWGVAKIDGLQLGEEPATLDNILDWPSEFTGEVLAIVENASMLGEAEIKNSGSPITSGAQKDGRILNTIAAPVN